MDRDTDIFRRAWAAGFLDGDGCFSLLRATGDNIHASTRCVHISASQRKREPLDELAEILGGSVGETTSAGRPLYQWKCSGAESVKIAIELVLPFLVNKREEAAIVYTYALSVKRRGRVAIPESTIDLRMNLIERYEEIRAG